MGCYVTVEITAKKGTAPAMLEAMREALPVTRSRDGCQSLELMVNQDEPENMVVLMRWQSRKHYDTYLAWRRETGVVEQFAAATEGGLSIRFFDVVDL